MTDAPEISVCVANYNGLDIIDDCLASVIDQRIDVAVEIIIHDDASTDGSAAHIRARHPDVRLLESRENAGFCIANNRMASVARGRYLLLLNNDAVLLPDALSTLLDAARRLGRAAVLGLPQYDAASGRLIDAGSRLDPFLNSVPNEDPGHGEVGMVAGACLWIDRSLWDELGGFPEWFGSFAEDLYLCCRARLAGHPVIALGASGFRHWVGASFRGGKVTAGGGLATTRRRRALSERNKSYVMAMVFPPPLFQLVFPLHLLLLALEGLGLALARWDWGLCASIYGACFRSLWRERARLRERRGEIQAGRKVSARAFAAPFALQHRKLSLILRHGTPRID